jgi:hypothetical protein
MGCGYPALFVTALIALAAAAALELVVLQRRWGSTRQVGSAQPEQNPAIYTADQLPSTLEKNSYRGLPVVSQSGREPACWGGKR